MKELTASLEVEEPVGALGHRVFEDRPEAELTALLDQGKVVTLEGVYKGSKHIRVPRWSARRWFSSVKYLSQVIAVLFPNDFLFLLSVNYKEPSTAAMQIAEIMERVYDEIMQIICITLCITEKAGVEEFIDSVSWLDVFEIFSTIIEQEVNNETAEAVLKKVQRLLVEKFHLENESFGFSAILGLGASVQSSMDAQ